MFHTEAIAAMRVEVARVSEFIPRFSEFVAGGTALPDHLQLPLFDKPLEQISRLVFAQIPQLDGLSTGCLLSTKRACQWAHFDV